MSGETIQEKQRGLTKRAKFTMRAAQPQDAKQAADLIYLPMGRLADYLFGNDDDGHAREVLAGLFERPQNRFSHQFSDVLEANGEVVGLLLAYPARMLNELAMPTGKVLREIIGVAGMLRLLRRSLPFIRLKEAEPDEFYVYTLAVRPDLQSHGLGKDLLIHGEHKAKTAGLAKCSLGVTMNNQRALKFYQRLGYEVVDTVLVPKVADRIGYPGYYRMVKHLA